MSNEKNFQCKCNEFVFGVFAGETIFLISAEDSPSLNQTTILLLL